MCVFFLSIFCGSWRESRCFKIKVWKVYIVYTRSEARFARLLLDCELSYCFHWVIVVVGGRVHEWCKKGSGIKGHILWRLWMWWWCACPRPWFDVIDDLVPTSAIISISQPKNSLTAEPFLTCNDGKEEIYIQSNLRTKDTLGTGLLSFLRRLSLSRRFTMFWL